MIRMAMLVSALTALCFLFASGQTGTTVDFSLVTSHFVAGHGVASARAIWLGLVGGVAYLLAARYEGGKR